MSLKTIIHAACPLVGRSLDCHYCQACPDVGMCVAIPRLFRPERVNRFLSNLVNILDLCSSWVEMIMVQIDQPVAIATGQKPHFFSQTSLQLVLRNRFFWNLFLRNLEDISNVSYDHVPDQFLLVQERWYSEYGYSTKQQGHLKKFYPETHVSCINELWWMIRPRIGPPTAPTNFFVSRMKSVSEAKTCVFRSNSPFCEKFCAAVYFFLQF